MPLSQQTLDRYHAGLDAGDHSMMMSTLSEDVVLRSPITGRTPIGGKESVGVVTRIVLNAFQGMTGTAHPIGDDQAMIRFTATVDGDEVEGVDLLRFDADGQICEVTVMVRPLPALVSLMNAIGADVARANGHPWLARLTKGTAVLKAVVHTTDRHLVPRVLRRRR